MQDHQEVCLKDQTTMKDDYNCCCWYLQAGPSAVASSVAVMSSAPGCSPTCVSFAGVLTALPEPNFILVGFSKAGFAQVVWFLKYLFCRPFTQHSYFYSE